MTRKKNDSAALYVTTDERVIEVLAEPADPEQPGLTLSPAPVAEGVVVEEASPLPSLEIERQLHAVRARLAELAQVERPGLVRMREELASSVQIDPTAIKKVGDLRILIEESESILASRLAFLGQALEQARRAEAPGIMARLGQQAQETLAEATTLRARWDAALAPLIALAAEFSPLQECRVRLLFDAHALQTRYPQLQRPSVFDAVLPVPGREDLQQLLRVLSRADEHFWRGELEPAYRKQQAA